MNIQYVDPTPQRKGRPDDIAFRSMPAHAQTRYAAGLEKESIYGIKATFGEVAPNEWAKSLNEWVKLGDHVFMSFNEVPRNGKLERDPIRLDDASDTERFSQAQREPEVLDRRWADQMNYRYWKDRCQAEQEPKGVQARELFYNGTRAYKNGDFPTAAEKFKEGLEIWKDVLAKYPAYRDDDLNKKDTGLIVKRYVRVLQQQGTPVPDNYPFKELYASAMSDTTVDPFDVLEMIGVVEETKSPSAGQPPAGSPPGTGILKLPEGN